MACSLEILGAAWGPSNVTKKVWNLVTKDGLSVKADNATFGPDPMRGQKALVVWYRYPVGPPRLMTAVENTTMKIEVLPKHQEEQASESMVSADWQATISNTSSRNPCNRKSITILGAAWGIEDVTEVARSSLLNGSTRFEKLATNEALGKDGWFGVFKVLVVVYQYSDIPMMSIVKEKETMYFTISPPLYILGAAYGNKVVTNEVQSLVKQHQLTLTPANDLPKHTSPTFKSFVMVYQFGSEQPQLHIGDQSSVCIRYESQTLKKDEDVVVDPSKLVILGAAYGLRDVTKKVPSTVFENKLQIANINNTTIKAADSWRWHYKTLVVMYRYGTGPPMVSIKNQDEKIEIQKDLPPIYGGLIDSKHLVSNTDTISLIALNNKYVAVDHDSGKLIANTEGSGCEFEIVLPSSNGPFFLQDNQSQKYCAVDDEGYLILVGNREQTGFLLTLSISGKVQLATGGDKLKKFVRLADNQFLKADSREHFSASTSFQLQVDCSATKKNPRQAPSNEISNGNSWLFFVWQTVKGFFLALGLEPFLSQSEPSADLLDLFQSNPNTLRNLITLRDDLRSTTSETDAIRSTFRFIRNVWKEGLLWKIFTDTEIFTRIPQAVLIEETEAYLLLAGLTTWATQLIEVSKKVEDL